MFLSCASMTVVGIVVTVAVVAGGSTNRLLVIDTALCIYTSVIDAEKLKNFMRNMKRLKNEKTDKDRGDTWIV